MIKNRLPEKITLVFGVITGLLILIHIINLFLMEAHVLSADSWFMSFFDLNKERNAPAFFSAFGLFAASVILALIASREKKYKRYSWLLLSLIFLFLSYDELLSFHERLIKPLRNSLNASGYLYFTWVVPYGIGVIFLFILFYKFLTTLPVKTKRLFILSGIIYVSGALGFEIISAKQYVTDGEIQTTSFRILYTIEESLEMSAVVLFLYLILDYLRKKMKLENNTFKNIRDPEKKYDFRKTGIIK